MTSYLKYFKTFPDFPKPGVLFYDVSPILADAALRKKLIDDLAKLLGKIKFDMIAGIDARGFIFGAFLAAYFDKGFVMMRKPGKLPGLVAEVNYGLEYGKGSLAMQSEVIKSKQKVLIVDDVLATGGTARAAAQLIEATGAKVAAFAFILELPLLKGRELLAQYEAYSLIKV